MPNEGTTVWHVLLNEGQAESIDHLQHLIEDDQSELVFTTIQKFEDVESDVQD